MWWQRAPGSAARARRVLGLGLGLLLAGLGAAAAQGLQSLRFEHLGAEQLGLQSSVLAVEQDAQGVIWLATADGLLRYDGRPGRVFAPEPGKPASLRPGLLRSLLQLPGQRLLIGTEQGLDELDLRTETLRRLDPPGAAAGTDRAARVLRLQAAPGGRVWVQRQYELLLLDPQQARFQAVVLPDLLPRQDGQRPALGAMVGDGQGGVWLLAGRELVHVDAQARLRQRWPLGPLGEPGLSLRSLLLDTEGRAWLGSDLGVRAIDTRSGAVLDLPQRLGLPAGVVHALLQDRAGGLWFGYGGAGLWHWAPGAARAQGHRHHPALRDTLTDNAISTLFEDRSGVIWVGHWGRGVSLVDPRSAGFRSYRSVVGEPDSLATDAVMALAPDGPEHVWVATYGRGLNRLNLLDGRAEHVPLQLLPMAYQKALLLQSGRLWVGGDTGLYQLALPQRTVRRVDLGAASDGGQVIAALLADRQGQVWAASAGGVHRLGPGERRRRYQRGAQGGLSHEVVDCLLEDRAGRIWAGSKAGLQRYEPAQDAFVPALRPSADMPRPDELPVLSLREDADGRVWVGTQLGLYELQAQPGGSWQLRSWRGLAGMPRGWIHSLELGGDGALWMASPEGLLRLDPARAALRHYPARRAHFVADFSQGGSHAGPAGSLLFGGAGVLWFEPAALRDNPVAPAVLLGDIRLFNRSLGSFEPGDERAAVADQPGLSQLGIDGPLAQARDVRLSHREAMVSFELRAQHFYSPQRLRYAWKLEGFDADWIVGRPGEGMATYTNLEPGRFRLLAKAANPDGVWGEARELLAVQVLPPWWQTSAFRGLLLLVAAASLVLAWRLRVRRLRSVQRQLETQVERRTAEVRAQRQQIATLSEIGRELTATLELETVKTALMGHLATLMPATAFGLGLVRRAEGVVQFDLIVEQGRFFKPYSRRLDASEQPAARCVHTGEPQWIREFAHDNRLIDSVQRQGADERLQLADGSEPAQARSALYVPLKIRGEVLGVLAVLSDQPDAFRQTHLDMLQTLGAYTAVALANADAYRELQATQTQLVEQRKLAALGNLVAGVAHELNTPLGNGLLAASTLSEDGHRLRASAARGQLRRSELEQFLQALDAGAALLLNSLQSASRLVADFKQLAVDRSSELRCAFTLDELVAELLGTRGGLVTQTGHALAVTVPTGLRLDSYPGPLRQVLEQLVDNAIEHGLAGRQGGRLQLRAEALGTEHVRLWLADDGRGIAPEHLDRVFDPFFTTRFGQGRNGLGLHLSYTLVTSLLGGRIRVRSLPGQGCEFEIELPLRAPP